MAEESTTNKPAGTGPQEELPADENETLARPGWREIFKQAFDKARREHQVQSKKELGRDRSRSLILLGGAAIALLLLFLGVFSSPNTGKKTRGARRPGTPNLGRKMVPGQEPGGQTGSVTPLLNAESAQPPQGAQGVTPEDVGRTARPATPSMETTAIAAAPPVTKGAGPYALGRIDFSDPGGKQVAPAASSDSSPSADLRKASLVFVRNDQSTPASGASRLAPTEVEDNPAMVGLPPGTRLVARLEFAASSAIKTPVIAAIEYNYERDGQIVVPAGAKALGNLQQADRSGNVAIHFDSIQMPDGATEKIDAAAMSLTLGPLKGVVSGKRTGTNFLVRTFTGLGQAATYLVGSNGLNGPLSESAFLRDRIATNIGIAGDQELNGLAFNQNVVVTVPGNTRFYVVIGKGTASGESRPRPAAAQQANNASVPTVEELRELLQLRREMSEMYQQAGTQDTAQQPLQQ